jgi:glycosyltransferase involved in cell wall biosynthesis
MDLIVEAFSRMPDKRLVVIGDGPDLAKVRSRAGRNVEMLGYQPFESLKDSMQKAKAFLFAAEEDFGILPVEAQACGTPVIAYGKGGSLETVVPLQEPGPGRENGKTPPTGLFFHEQTPDALIKAINIFEKNRDKFDGQQIRNHAIKFSRERFEHEFKAFVEAKAAERAHSS